MDTLERPALAAADRPARRLTGRLWRRGVDRVRRRGPAALQRALRLTGAALAAYLVAVEVLPSSQPLVAPLTALLIVQVTLFGTLTDGVRRVISVIAGVGLAVLFASFVGFSWWSLGLLIAASIIVGQLLRLGPHLLEVPISAMLVLSIGAVESAATQRVVETLIGASVGIAVNVLLPPAEQTRTASEAIEHYADEIVELLAETADELERDPTPEVAVHWVEAAKQLTRDAIHVERSLDQAQESRRLNPRALGRANPDAYLRSGLEALETCTVAIRALNRILAEGASAEPEGPDLSSPELRGAFADLLRAMGGAVAAFAAVLRSEAELEPEEELQDEDLAEALDAVRTARIRLSSILVRDPAAGPRQWQLHDAVLSSVERVLRELDVEERVRLRAVRRAASAPAGTGKAVSRLRASTRHLAEIPLRNLEPEPRPRRD